MIFPLSMTLKESVTLASDMELNSDLILGTGSSLGDNSLIFQGSSIYLPLELLETIRLADPLVLDPGSKFSNDSETLIVSGTTVGGEASFAEVLEVQNDFILPGESILKKTSMTERSSSDAPLFIWKLWMNFCRTQIFLKLPPMNFCGKTC